MIVNIIGEVTREGSELGTQGNAWLKHGVKILNSSPIRDVLVLTLPAMATEPLEILYENQICTLNNVEEKVALPVPKVCIILFTSHSCCSSCCVGGQDHLLCSANKFRRTNDCCHISAQVQGRNSDLSSCCDILICEARIWMKIFMLPVPG